jgi:hypothetical protein
MGDPPPGIGKAYCALLAFITNTPPPPTPPDADADAVNPLLARVPPSARYPGTQSPDGVTRIDSAQRLPDESGIKARIEEARYRETDAQRERDASRSSGCTTSASSAERRLPTRGTCRRGWRCGGSTSRSR